jgi:hypothetical protein
MRRFRDTFNATEKLAPAFLSLMLRKHAAANADQKSYSGWAFSEQDVEAINEQIPVTHFVPSQTDSGAFDSVAAIFTEWAIQSRTRVFLYNEYSTFSGAIHSLRMGQGAAFNSSFVY